MICQKCGSDIPEESVFCMKCGTSVTSDKEKTEASVKDEVSNSESLCENEEYNNLISHKEVSQVPPTKKKGKFGLFLGIALVACVGIVALLIWDSEVRRCESYKKCKNYKVKGGDYCHIHTCELDGCVAVKDSTKKYCPAHEREYQCQFFDCENDRIQEGGFCVIHTCEELGCYNGNGFGENPEYCLKHQTDTKVDMRERLECNFSFSLNSAGGIELTFNDKNISGKEIKYIKFYVDLYNAVEDKVKDEITGESSVFVNITGPIKAGRQADYERVIGYNDDCAIIVIREVTIEYMDGTTETGSYNYRYER